MAERYRINSSSSSSSLCHTMGCIRPYRINYKAENVFTKIPPTAMEIIKKNSGRKRFFKAWTTNRKAEAIIFLCLATDSTSLQIDNKQWVKRVRIFYMLASDINSERKGLISSISGKGWLKVASCQKRNGRKTIASVRLCLTGHILQCWCYFHPQHPEH